METIDHHRYTLKQIFIENWAAFLLLHQHWLLGMWPTMFGKLWIAESLMVSVMPHMLAQITQIRFSVYQDPAKVVFVLSAPKFRWTDGLQRWTNFSQIAPISTSPSQSQLNSGNCFSRNGLYSMRSLPSSRSPAYCKDDHARSHFLQNYLIHNLGKSLHLGSWMLKSTLKHHNIHPYTMQDYGGSNLESLQYQ